MRDLDAELVAAARSLRAAIADHPTPEPPVRRTAEQQVALGEQRLHELLGTAFTRTPYFSRIATDLSSRGLTHVTLKDLPVLTKAEVQANFARLLVTQDGHGRLPSDVNFLVTSSGSTGVPCFTLRNAAGAENDRLQRARLLDEVGCPLFGEQWNLGLRPEPNPALQQSTTWPHGVQWNFNALTNPSVVHQAVYPVATRESRPLVIFGNSKILDLMEYVREHDLTIRPVVVVWSYESLADGARKAIEETFGAPVRSEYGTAETGLCGWECSQGSLHFDPDTCVVEVLDDDGADCGPSDVGRLVVTALTSTSMPLIRYDTGDLATGVQGCSCELGTPSVAKLVGREAVRFVDKHGVGHRAFHVNSWLADEGLADFQTIQRVPGEIEVVARGVSEERLAAIVEVARAGLARGGKDYDLRPALGAPFHLAPSGKRNIGVSLLDGR